MSLKLLTEGAPGCWLCLSDPPTPHFLAHSLFSSHSLHKLELRWLHGKRQDFLTAHLVWVCPNPGCIGGPGIQSTPPSLGCCHNLLSQPLSSPTESVSSILPEFNHLPPHPQPLYCFSSSSLLLLDYCIKACFGLPPFLPQLILH